MRNSIHRNAALSAGLFSLLFFSGAQAQTISAVDKVVQDELVKQNIVGGAVAVIRNGKIIHSNGYGHRTLARETRITRDTSVRWASVSKSLTAVALWQADERGHLTIVKNSSDGDKLSKYVKDWPTKGGKGNITLRQLLAHRSGVTHYRIKDNCPDNKTPTYNAGKHKRRNFNTKQAVSRQARNLNIPHSPIRFLRRR
jgi:CubicO group peptidase (beta-lactamase class C family)